MIYVMIAGALGVFFVYAFLHELNNVLRDRKMLAINVALAKSEKKKETVTDYEPTEDGEVIEDENQEEEADLGDDDAILGL